MLSCCIHGDSQVFGRIDQRAVEIEDNQQNFKPTPGADAPPETASNFPSVAEMSPSTLAAQTSPALPLLYWRTAAPRYFAGTGALAKERRRLVHWP